MVQFYGWRRQQGLTSPTKGHYKREDMGFLILLVPYIVQKLIYKIKFTCPKIYTHQILVIWNMFRHNTGVIISKCNELFWGRYISNWETPWRWHQGSAETCSRLTSVWCACTLVPVKWYEFVTEHDRCLFGQDTAPPLCEQQTAIHSMYAYFSRHVLEK
jgi:hypothetical protein